MNFLFLFSLLLLSESLSAFDFLGYARSSPFFSPFIHFRSMHDNHCPIYSCSAAIKNNAQAVFLHGTKIGDITQIIAEPKSKCPSLALGAKRIDDYCYTVETNNMNFLDASTNCIMKGGYLAEPQPNSAASAALFTQLNVHFGIEIAEIQARLTEKEKYCYLGIRRSTTGHKFYTYQRSGQIIPTSMLGLIMPSPIDSPAFLQALSMDMNTLNSGLFWVRLDTNAGTDTTPTDECCSICQYEIIANP